MVMLVVIAAVGVGEVAESQPAACVAPTSRIRMDACALVRYIDARYAPPGGTIVFCIDSRPVRCDTLATTPRRGYPIPDKWKILHGDQGVRIVEVPGSGGVK